MATAAFSADPTLAARVNQALLSPDPSQHALISDIIAHVSQLQTHISSLTSQLHRLSAAQEAPDVLVRVETDGGPASKKRKLPVRDGAGTDGEDTALWRHGAAILTARDVSFSLPVRKKLTLEIVGEKNGGLRVVDTGKEEVEAGIAWADIDQIFALPVPEKATATTNFVVLPRRDINTSTAEALVWTVPTNGSPKTWTSNNSDPLPQDATYVDQLTTILNASLKPHSKRVITPSSSTFTSNITQPHLKTQKSHHIKAFRGSKEGYLYPLSTGILFAFRKPLLYYPFADITCAVYTSVLQRTFNLVIDTGRMVDGQWTEEQEEFGMLDQADFAPLDAYIKRYGLHDASLAAGRRAQSAVKAEHGGAVVEDGDEELEAAKAEQALQDAEDEEEDDFEVGSGSGESDGSGASESEEEEAEEDGNHGGGGGGYGYDHEQEGDEEDGYELDEEDEVVAGEGEGLEDQGRGKRRKL